MGNKSLKHNTQFINDKNINSFTKSLSRKQSFIQGRAELGRGPCVHIMTFIPMREWINVISWPEIFLYLTTTDAWKYFAKPMYKYAFESRAKHCIKLSVCPKSRHSSLDSTTQELLGIYVECGEFNGAPKYRFQGQYAGHKNIYLYHSNDDTYPWSIVYDDEMQRGKAWMKCESLFSRLDMAKKKHQRLQLRRESNRKNKSARPQLFQKLSVESKVKRSTQKSNWRTWHEDRWISSAALATNPSPEEIYESSLSFGLLMAHWEQLSKKWNEEIVSALTRLELKGHSKSGKRELMGIYLRDGEFEGSPKFRFQGSFDGFCEIYLYRSGHDGRWKIGHGKEMKMYRGWITTACMCLPHPIAANDIGGGGWEVWTGKNWESDSNMICCKADKKLAKVSSVRFEKKLSGLSLLKSRWSKMSLSCMTDKDIVLFGHSKSRNSQLMGTYSRDGDYKKHPKYKFHGEFGGYSSIYLYCSDTEGKWIVGAEDDMERNCGWIKTSQASLPHPFAANETSGGGWEYWDNLDWKVDPKLSCMPEDKVEEGNPHSDSTGKKIDGSGNPIVLHDFYTSIDFDDDNVLEWGKEMEVNFVDVDESNVSPI